MGLGRKACDMTQGLGATLREDVLGDPTTKCLAEISDLIGSAVIKEVLNALPNGSAITFSADQLEALFSGNGSVLAATKTTTAVIEGFANTCGCSFALHGDTGTFTKNLIDTA